MTPVRGTPRLENPLGPVSRGGFSRLGTAWLGTAWDSWHRVGLAGEPSRWVVTIHTRLTRLGTAQVPLHPER